MHCCLEIEGGTAYENGVEWKELKLRRRQPARTAVTFDYRYFVPFASALETATGNDQGFWNASGVSLMARYQVSTR